MRGIVPEIADLPQFEVRIDRNRVQNNAIQS